jgi:hypothetical protein
MEKNYDGAKAVGCMGMAIVGQLIVSILFFAAVIAIIKWAFF